MSARSYTLTGVSPLDTPYTTTLPTPCRLAHVDELLADGVITPEEHTEQRALYWVSCSAAGRRLARRSFTASRYQP